MCKKVRSNGMKGLKASSVEERVVGMYAKDEKEPRPFLDRRGFFLSVGFLSRNDSNYFL
ncbi:hypothetical protein SAMN05192532_101670 [Alteribacillus iranensis]|uniref:Uncharacterized protein n=1 Tax=Alteribacillus iranensis TaxID=930128 RepID=A0A1I2A867_9BACI|nr:hypothetical protein SAMN05192532_101670 [Alteribacillus iranensis]